MTDHATPTQQEASAARDALSGVEVGQRIKLHPGGHQRRWWTVAARDDRYLIAHRQEPFASREEQQYTVIDLHFPYRYNGAGPGVVRSSLNTLGGGWDVHPDGTGCAEALAALQSGEWEMSHRRLLDVRGATVEEVPA